MTDLTQMYLRLRELTEKRSRYIDRQEELQQIADLNTGNLRRIQEEINKINTELAGFGKSQDEFIEKSQ